MNTHEDSISIQFQGLLKECEVTIHQQFNKLDNPILNELFTYHLASGGGRNRAKLALYSGCAVNLAKKDTLAIAAACEMIHNASLLHDDIQDGDTHRRGREAAWYRFSVNDAMCAGTLMLSAAYAAVTEVRTATAELVQHMHDRTAQLISGQVLDLNHDNQQSSLDQYLKIAIQKSGSLMALPLELTMIASSNHASLLAARQAGESFALAYQIFDDLQDQRKDLINSSCNIVYVLEASGLSRPSAELQAVMLVEFYIQKALEQSQALPNNSGQLLADMCQQLSMALSPYTSQEAMQA
jgi:geranylgeranyl pyrophosphate synthase